MSFSTNVGIRCAEASGLGSATHGTQTYTGGVTLWWSDDGSSWTLAAAATTGSDRATVGSGSVAYVVPPVTGGYCTKRLNGALVADRNDAPFDTLVDGNKWDSAKPSSTWGIACHQPTEGWIGKTVLEIMAPKAVTELKIEYSRPLYAPGWKIYRDGALVFSEASNRGTSRTPAPATYSYALNFSSFQCRNRLLITSKLSSTATLNGQSGPTTTTNCNV